MWHSISPNNIPWGGPVVKHIIWRKPASRGSVYVSPLLIRFQLRFLTFKPLKNHFSSPVFNVPLSICMHQVIPACMCCCRGAVAGVLLPGCCCCQCIVLFKMFSRWLFANKKIRITLRTSKFGDVTWNVTSGPNFLRATRDATSHAQT